MELIVTTSAIYIAFLLLMQVSRYPLRTPHVLSGRKYAYPKGLFVAAFLTLTFVAAFRQGFVDTRVYKMLYEQIGTDWNNAFNETIPLGDYGFSLLMILLNRINSDPTGEFSPYLVGDFLPLVLWSAAIAVAQSGPNDVLACPCGTLTV